MLQVTMPELTLPCKDCRRPVVNSQTTAYHLIAGVLYGWCEECFRNRPGRRTTTSERKPPEPLV